MTDAPAEDACPSCGTTVAPRPAGPGEGPFRVERGSCTGCGLQLVRSPGEGWREIRG